MNFWDFLRFFQIFGFLDHFWQFFDFFGFLWFFESFLDFLVFFWIFWIFFGFFGFFGRFLDFGIFWNFLKFFGFFFVIVTNVTTKCYHGYYWTPKMGQNSIKSSFFARRAKKASAEGRSPPQELEVGPRSGPYLLVSFNSLNTFLANAFKQRLERQTGRPIANVTDQCQLSTRLALTKTDVAPLRFNSSLE